METPKRIQLQTSAKRTVVAYCWNTPSPKGVVIMAPAMAVPQAFYQPLCQWLNEQGYRVISFDYFGIGASVDQPLKQIKTTVMDWAMLDAKAVIDYAYREANGLPLVWLAHSISGQIFGLIPNHTLIDHVITVATGTGYWRHTTPSLKFKSAFLWFFVTPWLIPLAGYFPGRKLGIIGDVPAGAMQQWRRWCLHPHYLVGVEQRYEQYAQVTTPITAIRLSDDEMLTERNVTIMHDFYQQAPQRRILFTPHQLGVTQIGHFGAFKKSHAAFWPQFFAEPLAAALQHTE